ncbi:hypothetical protein KC351_g6028 [Hortaea werneckii]|nr:hypothetical protein KC351_g6028 [Hortaea werneckii]
MRQTTFVTLAAGATGAFASPIASSSASYACNPAHSYPNGASCVSTNGALSLVTPAPSSTGYACNPAHSYPNGASCVSTNGGLSLVTPAPSSTTGYACNPAHSYPNGASCVSTNGALSLVTPAPSSTGYACNPAHSYPNGASCVSTNGALSLVTPAPSSTGYACNPAHAYPNGASCVSTNGALSLVTPAPSGTTAPSAVASSATEAAVTSSASSGETKAEDLTWTVENLSRYCLEGESGCDYNFNLTASDDRPSQACTIIRLDVGDAATESWSNIPCTDGSDITVSWGYSAQFGGDNAFAVMTIVNNEEKAKAYFGVPNVNSQEVTASNPFGSGQYGDIGPEPVYLF